MCLLGIMVVIVMKQKNIVFSKTVSYLNTGILEIIKLIKKIIKKH